MKLAALGLLLLLGGCVLPPPPAPAPTPSCIPIQVRRDSVFIAAYRGPCEPGAEPDTVQIWRIPAQPGCIGTLFLDLLRNEVRVRWSDCATLGPRLGA